MLEQKKEGRTYQREIYILTLFTLILNGLCEESERNLKFPGKYNVSVNNDTNIEAQSEVKNEKFIEEQIQPRPCQSIQWSDKNCQIGPFLIKKDIAEEVFHQLCPTLTGKFEAPTSCDIYIVCHVQSLTVNRCQPSYHFNSKLQTCVDAQSYECSHPAISDPNSILNHTNFANSKRIISRRGKRSLISFETDISKPRSKVGESGIISKRSIRSNGNCPEDYIRPHPVSCDKFVICSNGKFFEQNCGDGAKFNPVSKVCDLPYNVDCESRISDLGTYDCQPNYIYITSHFEYCNKFIECDHGELHVKTCPSNTVFNADTSKCEYTYKTPCNNPISFEHDTDVNYLKRNSRDVTKYGCEFNYIAPIEGVCNEFLECEERELFRKSCGPGTAYNVLIGQCDWPDNVRAPNSQYCSRYLQCDGKHYVPRTCPTGTFFNTGNGNCETIETVDCKGKIDDPRIPRRPTTSFTPPPRTNPRTTPRTYPPIINSK